MANRTRRASGLPDDEELALAEELAYQSDPVEIAEDKAELELRDKMAQYIGESGAKIYIYDMDEKGANGSGVFIEKMLLSDLEHDELMERLRDVHYGGDFKLQIRNKRGHIETYQNVSVVRKERPKDEKEKKDDIAAIIEAVKGDQSNSSDMLTAMMAQQQQNMQMMMQQSQQQMTLLIEAMKANKPDVSNQPTMADMMGMMVSMKELSGGNEKEVDPMEQFLNGLKMGKEMGDTGGNDNILQTAIKTLGPSIAEATTALTNMPKTPTMPAQVAPRQRPMTEPQLAAPTPEPEASKEEVLQVRVPGQENNPQTEPNGDPEMDQQQLMVKMQSLLEMCHGAATINADPETYANLLLDQVGEELARQYIGDNDRYEQLFVFVPALVEHREWFDDLRGIIISYLENSDEDSNDVPTETEGEPEPIDGEVIDNGKSGSADVSGQSVQGEESNTH